MTPLNLTEWLEQVRAAGHDPDADFASEALEIVAHNRTDDANDMQDDLEKAAGQKFDDTWRLVEFFTDRHHLLDELVDQLDQAGFKGDLDDALGEVLAELEDLRDSRDALGNRLGKAGLDSDPDEALHDLLNELEDLRAFKEATEDATGGVVL